MNKFKTILILTSVCLLASCNTTPVDNVTSVEVAGPYSVLVGNKITLVADVVGSENDDVIWSSGDTLIATVDENGVVTGVSEGTVTITATSKNYPEFSGNYEVNVNLPKATSLALTIDEHELITQNTNGTYNIPLGLTFFVNVVPTPDNASSPDNITIIFKDADGNEIQSNSFVYEIESCNRLRVRVLESIENVLLIVKAQYEDINIDPYTTSLTMNIIDNNKDNLDRVKSLVNDFKVVEEEKLIGATINKEYKKVTEGVTTLTTDSISVNSFKEATYFTRNTVNTVSSDTTTTTEETVNSYSGHVDDNYYQFEYDNNKNVTHLYKNKAYSNNDKSLYFDTRYNGLITGFSNVLLDIITGDTFTLDGVVSLSNIYCYPNVDFKFGDSQHVLTSSYIDYDTETTYDVKLLINLDKTNVLSGYEYFMKSINEYGSVDYSEKVSFNTFGEKKNDDTTTNAGNIDFDIYNFESFNLVEMAGKKDPDGRYDYTNLKKYGADEVKVIDNVTTYILTYDKTLVLAIEDAYPSTASTLIDYIEAKSSDTEQIPSAPMVGDGIFAINAKKNDNGNSLPGEAFFTFKSLSGFEYKIKVIFTKAVVKDLLFTSSFVEDNTFNSIFEGRRSDFFFLNTDPDENIYTFGLNIIEGAEDGIELYDYAKDNLEGYPGFSFAILGKKPGSYKFKFYVKEATYIETEVYTIVVKEAYSVDYLKQNLIKDDVSYRYSTGTMDIILKFVSDTVLEFTQTMLGEDSLVQNVNYHFEKGKVVIEPSQKMNEKFYYQAIHQDLVYFNDDLSSFSFYMSYDGGHYNEVTFNKVVTVDNFEESIANKIAKREEFIANNGMTLLTLSLNNGKGVLKGDLIESGATAFNITFDYTFDKVYQTINVSNVAGGTSSVYLASNSFDVNLDDLSVRVKLFTGYSADYITLKY